MPRSIGHPRPSVAPSPVRDGATYRTLPALVLLPLARFLTDAGDSGVLLPIALVGVVTLWFFHSRRLAWLLLRSVLLAGVLITILKVLFLSCGAHWAAGLTSPSGHACLSAVVYGTLATLFAGGRTLPVRIAVYACAAAFVAAIAASRVALGVHTWLEVLVGLSIGLLAQLWFAWSYARTDPLRIDLKTFGAALVATLLVAFGIRLPAESIIRHMAKRLGEKCMAAAPRVVPPGSFVAGDGSARDGVGPVSAAGTSAQPLLSSACTSSASARAV
jgi:membrane-associated phospholipid phosphatase